MRGQFALLCPGQGAQGPAMFDLARCDPRTGALLDGWLADAGLGASLDAIFADERLLFSNRMAQPLIVAASLAAWAALGDDLPPPVAIAGYSIGELSAYAVAGSLEPADAVRLAAQRARLTDACLETTPRQALVALSGIPASAIVRLARPFGFHAAIETGDDSVVVGGLAGQRDALVQAAELAGARAAILPVEVASHTPLMQGAVAPFATLLHQQRLHDPVVPVLSGIAAEPVRDAAKAIDHLSRQIAETIRWKDCMDTLAEAGITVALELGPGAALARMLHARHPPIECRSIADFRSLDGVRKWLSRHLE